MDLKKIFCDFVAESNAIKIQEGYKLMNGVSIYYREKDSFVDLEKINKDGYKVCYSVYDARKHNVSDGGMYLNFDDNGEYYKSDSLNELIEIFCEKC